MSNSNPFANLPRLQQVRLGVHSDWQAGRVAICEHDDLEAWKVLVEKLADDLELGDTLEVQLNEATDIGFARVNKGFPIGMEPYRQEAREWSREPGQVSWLAQHSSWNRLFQGEPRGIC